jgi:hypothetical protein
VLRNMPLQRQQGGFGILPSFIHEQSKLTILNLGGNAAMLREFGDGIGIFPRGVRKPVRETLVLCAWFRNPLRLEFDCDAHRIPILP